LRALLAIVISGLLLVSCDRSLDSKFAGAWKIKNCSSVGQIDFQSDHKFVSHESSFTESGGPPVTFETGQWRAAGRKLVIDVQGMTYSQKAHFEFEIATFDNDTFVLRSANGILVLERAK